MLNSLISGLCFWYLELDFSIDVEKWLYKFFYIYFEAKIEVDFIGE